MNKKLIASFVANLKEAISEEESNAYAEYPENNKEIFKELAEDISNIEFPESIKINDLIKSLLEVGDRSESYYVMQDHHMNSDVDEDEDDWDIVEENNRNDAEGASSQLNSSLNTLSRELEEFKSSVNVVNRQIESESNNDFN